MLGRTLSSKASWQVHLLVDTILIKNLFSKWQYRPFCVVQADSCDQWWYSKSQLVKDSLNTRLGTMRTTKKTNKHNHNNSLRMRLPCSKDTTTVNSASLCLLFVACLEEKDSISVSTSHMSLHKSLLVKKSISISPWLHFSSLVFSFNTRDSTSSHVLEILSPQSWWEFDWRSPDDDHVTA